MSLLSLGQPGLVLLLNLIHPLLSLHVRQRTQCSSLGLYMLRGWQSRWKTVIPHFHASVPTGVGFSKQACLSGFLLAWLVSCGGLGFLLRSKHSSSLLGRRHRPGARARLKTWLLQLQGCCRKQRTALQAVLLQDTLPL